MVAAPVAVALMDDLAITGWVLVFVGLAGLALYHPRLVRLVRARRRLYSPGYRLALCYRLAWATTADAVALRRAAARRFGYEYRELLPL